jgi:hypothetical protein
MYLTPLIPLSSKERGKIYKRGFHPLFFLLPLPLFKSQGKGDTEG